MDNRKEEMAKMIARKIAANTAEPPLSMGVTDFGEEYYAPPQREYSRPRPAGKRISKKAEAARKKKKRAKVIRVTALTLSMVAITVGLTVLVLNYVGKNSYQDVFLDNTYINGVNVGGMNQDEALTELKKNKALPDAIYISRRSGKGFSIKLTDIGYDENSQELVAEYYEGQDKDNWLDAKLGKSSEEHVITENFNYNPALLHDIIKHKVLESQDIVQPVDAKIVQNDDGLFSIQAENPGDAVDPAKIDVLYEYIEGQLAENNFDINIAHVDCYKKPKVTSDELEEECGHLNDLANTSLTFDFGYATETLDYSTFKDWVEFDDDGPVSSLKIDEYAAERYVDELSIKYDTFGMDREFTTTNRGTITIPQGEGCYGWWLDKDGMTDMIVNHLEECQSYKGEAIYYENPYSTYTYTCNPEWRTEYKDFSDTYFEVDLSAQHLWYYEDGVLRMETDIVSGYTSASRNTPAGVYKLWLKERGKTLVGSSDGYSYSSYVEFWNYISTIGIGLHDASWQNGVFGGDKYKTSTWGSHGCINMPYDKAQYVYDHCAYNTPVFMYWTEEEKKS